MATNKKRTHEVGRTASIRSLAPREDAQGQQAEALARRRAARGLIGCVVAAFAHVVMVVYVITATDGETSAVVAALALPMIVTIACVPHARRSGWHRWLALLGIMLVVLPDMLAPALLVTETWVLHRFWVVEGGIRSPWRIRDQLARR